MCKKNRQDYNSILFLSNVNENYVHINLPKKITSFCKVEIFGSCKGSKFVELEINVFVDCI